MSGNLILGNQKPMRTDAQETAANQKPMRTDAQETAANQKPMRTDAQETTLITTLAGLRHQAGRKLGPTEWQPMTQDVVNQFAALTNDHNYIHVDPERARRTPFGGTIAHGFLTLSLLAPVSQELITVEDARTSINYGLNKVRFPSSLPVGGQFRGRGEILDVTDIEGGIQITAMFTIEVKDFAKPACVAECLLRFYR
jgi:acyl dehydratase